MTKVIKGEFKKIKDVKVEDVSLTCDTPLEAFNNEVNGLSRMDDDLFTYEVEVANIPCDSKIDDDSEHEADDDMGYDPSDVAFTEWLGSKIFNYKTMDHYTINALWIYWIRGDDEVELTDEESSDDMDEVVEVFRIDTSLFDFETPMCKAFKEFNYLLQIDPDLLTKDIEGFKTYEDYNDDWIYEWNKDVPWVDEKPSTNAEVWTKSTPDYEWYEALEDSKLKDKSLRNKAIMEGFIDDDDESRYEQMRRWNIYTNYDDAYEINHEDNKREELYEIPVSVPSAAHVRVYYLDDLTTRFLAQFFPPRRTGKLRNDILMFQQHHGESLSEAWTCFKDLLQKVPHHGIELWLQVQIFHDHVNPITRRTIDQSAGGKLRDQNTKESWELLEDLAFYYNESWNDPRDFAKPVKAIALPQDIPSISDRHLIELENQVQRLIEAHLALTQPTQVNKITTSYEICSGPHDTQCCMEDPE
ncbi:VIER F-box protein 2 [Tanacetum coccineum]